MIDDVGKLQWTLDNIYTVARREANRVSPHPKWAHVLRLCEAVGCQGRGVLRAGEDVLKAKHVLKHGTGYDLVIVEKSGRLHLGIKCHTCAKVSFHPKDITERYCGHCKVFHEDRLLSHEA